MYKQSCQLNFFNCLIGANGWQTTQNQMKESQMGSRHTCLLIVGKLNQHLAAIPFPFMHKLFELNFLVL